MRWQDKLTKAERAHVRKWGGRTLAGFKENRRDQRAMVAAAQIVYGRRAIEPCWECKDIARKLGLE